TTEYYKLNEFDMNTIDFVISSIPIPAEISVPVIEVNSVLGKQDIEHIESFLMEHEQSIHEYFQPELLHFRKDFGSKEEVLLFMSGRKLPRPLMATLLLSLIRFHRIRTRHFYRFVHWNIRLNGGTSLCNLFVC